MKYERSHQKALGIEPPDRVLWAALRAALPAEDARAVEAAYKRQSQRYQRACKLNQIARWVAQAEAHGLGRLTPERRAQYEQRRAILADPMKYVEGGD